MGRFFTSTQIYNPKQLDREEFKADFSKKMKKEGYEICEADCAELSYVIAFADNCKWVTISSEAYEQGNLTAQADTARIAKMLGTYCINTTVIDSDCAMLDLYDDKGKKQTRLLWDELTIILEMIFHRLQKLYGRSSFQLTAHGDSLCQSCREIMSW